MVRRLSRQAHIAPEVRTANGDVIIRVTVASAGRNFVSSEDFSDRIPVEWTLQYRLNLRDITSCYSENLTVLDCRLEEYSSLLSEFEGMWRPTRSLPSSDLPEADNNQPSADEWRNANFPHIIDRLNEFAWYKSNAGVIPSPPKFYDEVERDLGSRYSELEALMGQVENERGILMSEYQRLVRECTDAYRKKCIEFASGDLDSAITTMPMMLLRDGRSADREYALFLGAVWECRQPLVPEQWRVLILAFLQKEEAELVHALSGAQEGVREATRKAISTVVRRAVWSRDHGCCAQCGSRDRLEYDHIIPLSRGGSNTERNIELLCEACNRAKSDSIS